MHLKELNHRSPLRVFERSVHGGLGRGNLGVVAASAGVGKGAFLTAIALESPQELLRYDDVLPPSRVAPPQGGFQGGDVGCGCGTGRGEILEPCWMVLLLVFLAIRSRGGRGATLARTRRRGQ